MAWMNDDGLYIKYGQEEGEAGSAGQFAEGGAGIHVVEAKITLTDLGTAAAIIDDNVFIPEGVRILEVQTIVDTAATSGGAAVLNVGLQRRDRSTELDYDGLIAALALTSLDAAGEQTTQAIGSASDGALVGTTLANSGYLTADYDTAAFTAGVVRVRVKFYKP